VSGIFDLLDLTIGLGLQGFQFGEQILIDRLGLILGLLSQLFEVL
jgi:hypothetical protein